MVCSPDEESVCAVACELVCPKSVAWLLPLDVEASAEELLWAVVDSEAAVLVAEPSVLAD